jgi:2-polyprenyl-3-methyl-5-hydroxy-6-metoxy-1,4-benzoquinol methylase
MKTEDSRQANKETQQAWEQNASYWDERIGEGNDFVEVLIWPAVQRLLDPQPGECVLDAACGNGLYARRLAALGAEVVAFDFSENLIALARQRTTEHADRIEYLVMDATDETALLTLGKGRFDAVICNMALFDIADIQPLMRALVRLLRSDGRFVFSVMHPCFNNPHMTHIAEMEDNDGQLTTTFSVRISSYLTPTVAHAAAIAGQPKPQLVFHRPLQDLLGCASTRGLCSMDWKSGHFPRISPAAGARSHGEETIARSRRCSSRVCGCWRTDNRWLSLTLNAR